jgi:hypothetical protein
MKIKLLDPEFNLKGGGAPVLESVDGMFTLTSTEEDVAENTYSHCTETVRFTEEWAKQNPDIFEILPEDAPELEPKPDSEAEPEAEPESNFKGVDETSSMKSFEAITERLNAVQKDIEFLKSIQSEELKGIADRYNYYQKDLFVLIDELKIVRNTLEWVLNIEESEDGE